MTWLFFYLSKKFFTPFLFASMVRLCTIVILLFTETNDLFKRSTRPHAEDTSSQRRLNYSVRQQLSRKTRYRRYHHCKYGWKKYPWSGYAYAKLSTVRFSNCGTYYAFPLYGKTRIFKAQRCLVRYTGVFYEKYCSF